MDAVTHNPEQFNLVITQIHCADGAPGQFTNHHEKYTQLRCSGTAGNGSEESGHEKNNLWSGRIPMWEGDATREESTSVTEHLHTHEPERGMFQRHVLVPAREIASIIHP